MNFSLPFRSGLLALVFATTAAAQTTVDFPVVQDTWVNSNNTTRNYGSQTTTQVRDGDRKISYLQFQVIGVTGVISNAELHFRFLYDSGTLSAYKVTDQTWDEYSMTYANKPTWNSTASGSASASSGAWCVLPVTSAVSGNGLVSFAIRSNNINGEIYSKESTNTAYVPYLRVTYQDTNQPPVAQGESYTVLNNTLRSVAAPGVLSNDSDPNSDPLTAQLVTAAAHGTVVLNANGSFTYQPASGYTGADSFVYRAVDTHNGSSLTSANTTVSLTILPAGTGQLTAAEISQIQTDLGITLGLDQQLELAALVKPTTSEAWRTDANARIEQNRKADINITVVNGSGAPVPNASVEVKLNRKAFLFGGVLDLTEFSTGIVGGLTSGAYRALPAKYFDAVGLNNALKPRQSFYQNPAVNIDRLENDFFPWCASINMPCRGHLLQWPGLDHMSAPVEAKVVEIETVINGGGTPTQTQLDELRALVDNEISTWAARWPVYQWDVVNEVLSNHRIQDIMGPDEIVRWYQLAQTASTNAGRPDTGRLLNEFQIISGNAATNGPTRITNFKNQVQYLIDQNAPITGLGFQSRFKFRREDPALLYSRLEQFAVYNKDMVATEFEVVPNEDGSFTPDENLRAQMTEETMTTYFSHAKVTGFFAWEFASTESRALLNIDGSPKLNALVWYYLNRIRYNTHTTLTTNALGQVSLRGFKGDYSITVNTGSGGPVVVNRTVNANSSFQVSASAPVATDHTVNVLEDAHAQEASPTAIAPSSETLQLRTPNGSLGRVAYLKFDLSQITGTVVSAKLRLYSVSEPHTIQALAVASQAWTESTLTWNTRPATGAVLGTNAATTVPGSLDITLDPASVTPGGSWSVALNETGNSYGTVASSENTSSYPIPQLLLSVVNTTTNEAPVFSSDPMTGVGASVNAAYAGTLAGAATDADPGDTVTYAKVSGPAWLQVSPNGVLSGIPTPADIGSNSFTVSASDGTDSTTAVLNISVASDQTTLNVVEDTHAQEGNPTATAPLSGTLQLRTPNGTLGRVAYLKFNLPQITGTIQTATLRLFIPPAGGTTNGETNLIQALTVTDHSWTETGLNWNNRPATGAVLGSGSLAAASTPGTLDISLNPASITPGGMWSLALNETGNSYGTVASSENTSSYPIPQLLITTRLPDSDGDGIPDVHEAILGLNPLLQADGQADADGDGFSNLMEYALGGNLNTPSKTADFITVSHPVGAGTVNLTLRRRTGLTGGPVVKVGASGALGSWTYHLPESLAAAGYTVISSSSSTTADSIGNIETLTLTLSSAADRGFFRMQVTYP